MSDAVFPHDTLLSVLHRDASERLLDELPALDGNVGDAGRGGGEVSEAAAGLDEVEGEEGWLEGLPGERGSAEAGGLGGEAVDEGGDGAAHVVVA